MLCKVLEGELDGAREEARDKERMKRGGRTERIIEIEEREKEREREGRSKLFFLLFAALDSEQREVVRCKRLHPPVVAFWLWCHSGGFTVPPGLYTCQPARQAACTTRPRRRGREKRKFLILQYLACFLACCLAFFFSFSL